jgi:DNA-binding SARP family transcriptional activator/tetratricopeptide (TPR) repeat protein
MDAERSAGPVSAAPRFGILGPLQVVDIGHRPVPLGGPRARELLALMLLNPNRPLSAERLVTALWGEGASEGAATTLRTHVATVRRVLAAAGVGETLTTHLSGYVLDLHRGDLDADVFEGLVHRGQEALGVGDPGQAAAILRCALDLWRGDVLSDIGPPDFADTTVARLEELRVVAEETAMAAALALGQHREVVPRLQELVAAHPFHEQLSAQLVLALYRSGRQVDALTAYAETKQRLGEELGLDPGPDLQALETAVLRQDPALLLSVERLGRSESTSRSPAARQPPDAVFAALRRIPMVGRDAGLRTLREAWQETLDGGRGIVAVSGTAGVGKSRLAAELAQLAEVDGAAVLIGRCDASVPYAALSSALGASATVRQVVAEAPPGVRARLHPLVPLDPDAEIEPHGAGDTEQRQALVRSVEWVLASLAADGPVLFVVEDAERLDDVESGVLAAIGTRLPERILLVVCFRDPPGSRHPPLADLVGRRGLHELTRTIFLESLSREDLGEMVASMHPAAGEVARPFVEALWQQTAGNPFFAREVLRDVETADLRSGRLRHDLPAGVRDVLRHRLGSLAADTREAVAAAAVLGREVELGRLSQLLQEPEDRVVPALDQALASGFLVEAGQSWAAGYAFPHELMRDAVYAEIPLPRRQRLHQRAVDVILGPQAVDADVIAAAGHAMEAGPAADPAEASELLKRAASLAAESFGYEVAVRLAEARLPLLRRYAGAADQARADVEVARLRLRAGSDYGRVVELLERALATYLSIGDTEAAGQVHSRLGGALVVPRSGMDVVRSLEHFAAAERLLPEATDLFSLQRGRLSAAMHALDTDTMAAAAGRCSAIAITSNRRELEVFAGWGRGWLALDRGQPAAALGHLERAWSVARDLGDPLLGWPPSNAASLMCTVYLLDPSTGRSWCRRGLGQPRFATLAHPNEALADQLVLALATTGELEAARRAAARLPAEAVGRRLVRFLLGDWEDAATEWRRALDHDGAAGDRHDAVVNARWLADALLLLGDEHDAADTLDEALEIATSAPQVPSEIALRARLASLSLTPPDHASAHLSRCDALMAGDDWRGLVGEVELARAAVAIRHEQWEAAETAAEQAVSVFDTYRLPWRRAAALQTWARALTGSGRPSKARARHAEADAVLVAIGAPQRWRTAPDSTRSQRTRPTLEA